MTDFNKPTEPKTQQQVYDELRNGVIEEVAMAMERMKGFGRDTIDSLTVYIREMKTTGRQPVSGLHTCPYEEEIHEDYETLCDCDEEATRQCAQDI